jgi:hypothetical protein
MTATPTIGSLALFTFAPSVYPLVVTPTVATLTLTSYAPTAPRTFTLLPIGREPNASPRTRRLESLVQMNFDLVVDRMDAMDAAIPAKVAGVVESNTVMGTPAWVKHTVTYADISAACGPLTTNVTINFYTIAANTMILMVVAKHSIAFTGGALADYSLAGGPGSLPSLFWSGLDVFAAPSNTGFAPPVASYATFTGGPYVTFASNDFQITAGSSGHLIDATQGSCDFWVLSTVLP